MKVYAKSGTSNVRAKQTTTSGVVGSISASAGADLIVTSEPIQGYKWHEVKLSNGKIGYVRSDVAVLSESKVSKHPYKDVTFEGYKFPDATVNANQAVSFSKEMKSEYIPVIDKMEIGKGVKLLATIMAQKEGFYKGTRSYRTNNPGNIGNTDSGANSSYKTLQDGIMGQVNYITRVGNGTHTAHKFGSRTIKPYYSPEIAKNQKTYGIDPYLPGYKFDYQGQLGAFVKIYSTGARAGNGYLSQIVSYFKQNGITITQDTTIAEIVNM